MSIPRAKQINILGGLNAYQEYAVDLAIYPVNQSKTYPLLGLIGEVGEFANKYKKVLRDNAEFTQDDARAELGDILWYVAALANDYGLDLGNVAMTNIDKLYGRQARGTLGGSGDDR